MRAEIKITLRGRSASPITTHSINNDHFASEYYGNGSASEIATTALAAARRHSFTSASQFGPISQAPVEDAQALIGRTVCAVQNESVTAASYQRDLETSAATRLPPVPPGSVLLRAPAGLGPVANSPLSRKTANYNSTRKSRPLSGNFSSTYLINKPGRICITRSKSFKTLRRCDSPGSLSPPSRPSSPHPRPWNFASSEITETPAVSVTTQTTGPASVDEAERLYAHIPTPWQPLTTLQSAAGDKEDPSLSRLRSVASIESFVYINPNAKLPPARPQNIEQRNGMINNSNASNNKRTAIATKLQPESTSTPSLERSAVQIVMTGGGNRDSTDRSAERRVSANTTLLNGAKPRRSPTSSPLSAVIGRIQLPCTRASSRNTNNNHVMTDSLKLYEEQIFSHQILSGQRPLSWCIDTAFLGSNSVTPSTRADSSSTGNQGGHSSGSPSSSTASSNVSSSSSSYGSSASNHSQLPPTQQFPHPPRIGQLGRLARPQSGLARFSRSTEKPGISSDPKNRNLPPLNHALRPDSPRMSANAPPPIPPSSRVAPRGRFPERVKEDVAAISNLNDKVSWVAPDSSSGVPSLASSSGLSTVRPACPNTPPTPPIPANQNEPVEPEEADEDEGSRTPPIAYEDDSFPTPSMSLLPPPLPWKDVDTCSPGNQHSMFVCPYCRAISTLCRCSASITTTTNDNNSNTSASCTHGQGQSWNTDGTNDEEEEGTEESTYAFSTLDSDFISWMRLSVRDVTVNHPCNVGRRKQSADGCSGGHSTYLASLTGQEITQIVSVFNTNPLGLHMSLAEGGKKLIGTIRVYINLIKPVKMSLRQTMRHLPTASSDSGAVPDRLISFFLPRGGSRLLQLAGNTSAEEVIQCLLDRFHIQESASKFALYEHTLETKTIFSRKLAPSERPLSMVTHWVRDAISTAEDFRLAIRRKRIVLQENDNSEVNWKEFSAAELSNFLRILEKEEAEYRNAIYFQYGVVRQRVEQRMAHISAHDRLLAARHSVATCPPSNLLSASPSHHHPDQHPAPPSRSSGMSTPPAASL